MTRMVQMVCPVEGCAGWRGRPQAVPTDDPVDDTGLHEHLALEHPDLADAELWYSFDMWERPSRRDVILGLLGRIGLALAVVAILRAVT